ncbi:F-box domain containing protein [Parasponia andersonii]|uniref:F-box domain containing protein n=1 Tax=Parasponia andersonii TaxID=3476 RepID=A0A2P5BTV2_PARAD|nr:F-box domain containing protein [Parasponia andersonii]
MSKSLRTTADRFTSFPDDVAHKVVSFVSLEDVSRLSVVSRRCRQLCISMPSLNVDVSPYQTYLDSSVNDNGGDEEDYRILSWLHSAVTCNVKWLVLYLRFLFASMSHPFNVIGVSHSMCQHQFNPRVSRHMYSVFGFVSTSLNTDKQKVFPNNF